MLKKYKPCYCYYLCFYYYPCLFIYKGGPKIIFFLNVITGKLNAIIIKKERSACPKILSAKFEVFRNTFSHFPHAPVKFSVRIAYKVLTSKSEKEAFSEYLGRITETLMKEHDDLFKFLEVSHAYMSLLLNWDRRRMNQYKHMICCRATNKNVLINYIFILLINVILICKVSNTF